MPDPHVIRLRGPWHVEALARDLDGQGDGPPRALPPASKTPVPGDWSAALGADFLGTARYTRHFNRPTNLGPHERVWLVLEGVDDAARVALNGRQIGQARGCQRATRIDITSALEMHNTLTVDVSLARAAFNDPALRADRAGQSGGLIGEVRLEIGLH
jgi:beta-galactosidase/beta-glucuronidase